MTNKEKYELLDREIQTKLVGKVDKLVYINENFPDELNYVVNKSIDNNTDLQDLTEIYTEMHANGSKPYVDYINNGAKVSDWKRIVDFRIVCLDKNDKTIAEIDVKKLSFKYYTNIKMLRVRIGNDEFEDDSSFDLEIKNETNKTYTLSHKDEEIKIKKSNINKVKLSYHSTKELNRMFATIYYDNSLTENEAFKLCKDSLKEEVNKLNLALVGLEE